MLKAQLLLLKRTPSILLISPKRKSLLLDPVLGDDVQVDPDGAKLIGFPDFGRLLPVTSVNLPLSSRDENIMDNIDGLFHADWILVNILHVHEPHLVVQQWLQEGDS